MTASEAPVTARPRPMWRSVAVPSEHGGWGLTLEPVLLGLLVAPSVGGVALGVAAFLAFLVRTPLKLAAVDARRHRWLDRSRLAARLAAVELTALVLLALVAGWTSGWSWLVPVAIASPLVAVELWFDVRSRGRRLVPEVSGAVGICGVAAAIAVAGGESAALAAALWLVPAGRAVGAIPFVRTQIIRLRRGAADLRGSDLAQVGALAVAGVAVAISRDALAGSVGVAALGVLQALWVRRPPVPAKVLGMRQMGLGLALVVLTALGVAVG